MLGGYEEIQDENFCEEDEVEGLGFHMFANELPDLAEEVVG